MSGEPDWGWPDGVAWHADPESEYENCCSYVDHTPAESALCACPEHPESHLHPLGTKPGPVT